MEYDNTLKVATFEHPPRPRQREHREQPFPKWRSQRLL